MAQDAVADRVKVAVEQRLVESGEKERLQEILRAHLIESGWKDHVKAQCRDIIRARGAANSSVEQLMREVAPDARANIPENVKRTLLTRLKTYLMENIQDLDATPPSQP
ncbi:hypothetical protein IWQ60_000594 [Tieghemiomyces parasiticus]|uniref:Transcription and mRNA export factor SUS1 n=1 Tax=Tieghemiomyces parasiticus TaxID=78921 RepID=A0A9W8AG96_9FUNG|nr:hypothetical protein IWQ60_002051 [Tieghemiomyces parasiticus]KAJ1930120.1 hypothetical protein IWQ60_000594 [Tieghemiomyces parasiticus]